MDKQKRITVDYVLQYVFDGESDFEEIDDENDRFG